MIRLFVAIDLPEPLRQQLALLCAGVPGAKWVKPEQMHLTLRFIGEVDNAVFADIASALGAIAAPPFELQLAGVGTWGDRRKAHVLWVGVKPSPGLMHLRAKIESALVRLGIEPDRRKFAPHVTLARLNGAPESRVAGFLAGNGDFAAPPFPVDQFLLYSSFLGQSGAIHRIEAHYPLGDRLTAEPGWLPGDGT
jgi:2'-5' RNA ligase